MSRAVSALRLTPVMFEAGARPYPPAEVYRAYLAQADVFIGVYWQRYGQLVPGARVSGLEEEFDLSGRLPRLLYVKGPAPDRDPRLADLLDRIKGEASASYRHFRTSGEVGRLVRDDLAVLLSERFGAGGGQAGAAASPAAGGRRRGLPDAARPPSAARKPPRAIRPSPATGSLATLARWCRIRSYLDSAANHGLTALDAISSALAGSPWLPASPAAA